MRRFVGDGRTVILTTHYLGEADALADRIVLLDQGRIIAEGSPSEVKARTLRPAVRALTRLERLPSVTSVRHD